MKDLKNKKVLVVGLGKSGVAAAKFCVCAGACVTATDAKPAGELEGAINALDGLNIALSLGTHDPSLFETADVIVLSPGVPADLPELARARKRGAAITGEMELAVARINRPIVAVTGTNGKTTTTSLIGHLLECAGIRPCVAGNIGTPLIEVLGEANAAEVVVLEVSSFQIETAPSLSPHIAIFLNATPDHLDRHATFEEYVDCKAKLLEQVGRNGFGIYNAADESVVCSVASAACRLVPFDATGKVLPCDTGKFYARFGGNDMFVRTSTRGPSRYPLSLSSLKGKHNRENMLAALAAAELCGADPAKLAKGLESFKGLPHRVEFVRRHNDVSFYDDSKGTNLGATIRAIEGFEEPIVLIAGGLSKGVDFTPLAPFVRDRVKKVILIGQAAADMQRILSNETATELAASMDEAVAKAFRAAKPGDVVLLSPACASFDMFKDYADRGRAFVQAVLKITTDERR